MNTSDYGSAWGYDALISIPSTGGDLEQKVSQLDLHPAQVLSLGHLDEKKLARDNKRALQYYMSPYFAKFRELEKAKAPQREASSVKVTIVNHPNWRSELEVTALLEYRDQTQTMQPSHTLKWYWNADNTGPESPEEQYSQYFEAQDVSSSEFAPLLQVLFPHKEEGYFAKLQEKYDDTALKLWLFKVDFNSRSHSVNLFGTGEPSCAAHAELRKVLGQAGAAQVLVVAADSIKDHLGKLEQEFRSQHLLDATCLFYVGNPALARSAIKDQNTWPNLVARRRSSFPDWSLYKTVMGLGYMAEFQFSTDNTGRKGDAYAIEVPGCKIPMKNICVTETEDGGIDIFGDDLVCIKYHLVMLHDSLHNTLPTLTPGQAVVVIFGTGMECAQWRGHVVSPTRLSCRDSTTMIIERPVKDGKPFGVKVNAIDPTSLPVNQPHQVQRILEQNRFLFSVEVIPLSDNKQLAKNLFGIERGTLSDLKIPELRVQCESYQTLLLGNRPDLATKSSIFRHILPSQRVKIQDLFARLMNEDQIRLFRQLQEDDGLRSTLALFAGPPGSGKSYCALLFAMYVAIHPVWGEKPQAWSLAHRLTSQLEEQRKKDKAKQQKEHNIQPVEQNDQPTAEATEIVDDAEIDRTALHADPTEVISDSADTDKANNGKHEAYVNTSGLAGDSAEPSSNYETEHRKAKVLIVAGPNATVDFLLRDAKDVVRVLTKESGGKMPLILRIHSIKTEGIATKNIGAPDFEAYNPRDQIPLDITELVTEAESCRYAYEQRQSYIKSAINPLRGIADRRFKVWEHSLAHYALQLARVIPPTQALMDNIPEAELDRISKRCHTVREFYDRPKVRSPFDEDKMKELFAQMESLFSELVKRAGVIVTTVSLAHDSLIRDAFKPQIIIVDEVTRLIEAELVGLFFLYPFARIRLFLGDTKQLGPLVLSSEDDNPFVQYLPISLLERLEECGIKPYEISKTMRFRASELFELAKVVYGDKVPITKADIKMDDTGVKLFQSWIKKMTKVDSPVVLISPTQCEERRDGGTSKTNPVTAGISAYYITKFVEDHPDQVKNIAYISPWKAQRQLVRRLLNNAETKIDNVDLEEVAVETVDGFMGDQRSFIIFDQTWTKHIGFCTNPRRLVVALTRARDGLIYIAQEDSVLRSQVKLDHVAMKIVDYFRTNMLVSTVEDVSFLRAYQQTFIDAGITPQALGLRK